MKSCLVRAECNERSFADLVGERWEEIAGASFSCVGDFGVDEASV